MYHGHGAEKKAAIRSPSLQPSVDRVQKGAHSHLAVAAIVTLRGQPSGSSSPVPRGTTTRQSSDYIAVKTFHCGKLAALRSRFRTNHGVSGQNRIEEDCRPSSPDAVGRTSMVIASIIPHPLLDRVNLAESLVCPSVQVTASAPTRSGR